MSSKGESVVKAARIETAFDASEGAPTWVRLVRAGSYVYQGKSIELTAEDLAELVVETRRWIADNKALAPIDAITSYYPPILKEHARTGERFGSVVDFEVRGEGEEAELWGKLRPLQEVYWGIEDGRYTYVSLRIVWGYTSAEGETYTAIVEEVSLTGTPFFKNIGSLRDYFGISCSDTLAEELQLLFSDPQGGDQMAMTEQEKQALASANSRAENAEKQASALEKRIDALEKKPALQASEPVKEPEAVPAWATKIQQDLDGVRSKIDTLAASDTPITLPGQAPSKTKPKTLEQAVKELMASEGVSEERAWELSCERHPDLF